MYMFRELFFGYRVSSARSSHPLVPRPLPAPLAIPLAPLVPLLAPPRVGIPPPLPALGMPPLPRATPDVLGAGAGVCGV